MSTRSRCRLTFRRSVRRSATPRTPSPRTLCPVIRLREALACCLFLILPSCGMSQGAALYLLGFGTGKIIEAQFRLAQGPLLILIDDSSQRVDWPPTKRYLFDELAQELLRNQAASKIIPAETLAHLRQIHPDFDKRGCRELGKLAGAEQVLWIEIQSFRAEQRIEEALVAAYFTVTVKVIDASGADRSRVRLWPTAPLGQGMTATMTGSEVSIAKTKDGIARKLAGQLAVQTAKLFYNFRLGDFEREP